MPGAHSSSRSGRKSDTHTGMKQIKTVFTLCRMYWSKGHKLGNLLLTDGRFSGLATDAGLLFLGINLS